MSDMVSEVPIASAHKFANNTFLPAAAKSWEAFPMSKTVLVMPKRQSVSATKQRAYRRNLLNVLLQTETMLEAIRTGDLEPCEVDPPGDLKDFVLRMVSAPLVAAGNAPICDLATGFPTEGIFNL